MKEIETMSLKEKKAFICTSNTDNLTYKIHTYIFLINDRSQRNWYPRVRSGTESNFHQIWKQNCCSIYRLYHHCRWRYIYLQHRFSQYASSSRVRKYSSFQMHTLKSSRHFPLST